MPPTEATTPLPSEDLAKVRPSESHLMTYLLTSGRPTGAPSAPMIMSQFKRSSVPPPKDMPLTAAIKVFLLLLRANEPKPCGFVAILEVGDLSEPAVWFHALRSRNRVDNIR